ncbi:HNH endonuclease [Planococcus sp. NCCP-2050]|uniref:HNH endonuclease n=1 Tax=Planococcus sp. NCCP-2050 TaxID=2944679 RepID=UPI00203A9B88|nr:HNH endonuclease [Planococcus sp. NCCP-2050]GKW47361.1 hypothetical protein NCCP2050_30530 [Planococcus sp. NCCP-2050]
MIYLERPKSPPNALITNAAQWKSALIDAVNQYGGYKSIPKDLKEALIGHYRHDEIKDALFKMSIYKCAFCESKPGESGNIEVEHFAPKSEYPELTFEWGNLLPVCRKCNGAKGNLDTKSYPIVNPCEVDPEDYFEYESLFIIPKKDQQVKTEADRTIQEVDLNSPRLFKGRADLLVSLSAYIVELNNWLSELKNLESGRARHNRIIKLNNSLELIESLKTSEAKYSAFTIAFLKNNTIYEEAKNLVNSELLT